jgi:UDP-N-acetylmuramoyl-tripeptide--D-alanyl-D-alanine ligase
MIRKKIKKYGRRLVSHILESQVRRLRARHAFQVVAVAGSIGKTSTKMAIAHTLEPTRRVMYQTGNYNDRVTVPLVFFGRQLPGLFNVWAWLKIFMRNELTIRLPSYYEVVVVELGTDWPGQMKQFEYCQPDIAVVTGITPEHMSYFKTLDAVATEELVVCDYSAKVLINSDDTPAKYLKGRGALTYGLDDSPTYKAAELKSLGLQGTEVELQLGVEPAFTAQANILGKQGIKILLAAAATAQLLGLNQEEIQQGLKQVVPFAGRMQILSGIRDTTIIDDTYNASPQPVMAALDVLYAVETPQRIAILGTMNEFGDQTRAAHEEVGGHCRPDKLDLIVTIGADAEKYLAPVAEKQGCRVKSVMSPYEAGDYVKANLRDGAVILAEGSQNRVFAEEALKVLLADTADQTKLVRQSDKWLRKKALQFPPPKEAGAA